ncbi:uncharacterized protein LOC106767492 isoform X2 [Vigna radiata var. radiata]|uniref:Uncharacterized protein LOC106767492 isoform X2 n=1 Tax=Vigna radiata var. radiata TaxID=3916 RepID=A0A1S3UP86_VIGRR|nr:uncharacterized protein LOC106767492 isoform X2 [Vigna radiata var. radiata]
MMSAFHHENKGSQEINAIYQRQHTTERLTEESEHMLIVIVSGHTIASVCSLLFLSVSSSFFGVFSFIFIYLNGGLRALILGKDKALGNCINCQAPQYAQKLVCAVNICRLGSLKHQSLGS